MSFLRTALPKQTSLPAFYTRKRFIRRTILVPLSRFLQEAGRIRRKGGGVFELQIAPKWLTRGSLVIVVDYRVQADAAAGTAAERRPVNLCFMP